MAQTKSVMDYAIEHIDAQIADLVRAKQILELANGSAAMSAVVPPKMRKPRGPNKKRGLPATDESSL